MADVFTVITGHGVVTPRVPRVATQQPPARKPNALSHTVTVDRGLGVFRARWIKPAIASEHGAYGVAIAR